MSDSPINNQVWDVPDEYFSKLGRLQHAYTTLEVDFATDVGSIISNNPIKLGDTISVRAVNAVVGSMRMKESITLLKRLFRVINVRPEITEYAETLWKHVGDIQFLRNRLTHYQTDLADEGSGHEYINSDLDVAHEIEKEKTYGFKLRLLDTAAHDLIKIGLAHSDIIFTLIGPDDLRPFERPALLYKPSELILLNPQWPKNPLPPLPPHPA